MKKRQRKKHHPPPALFEGNVWVMPSAQAAKEVYTTLLRQFLEEQSAEWSLVSGFFQKEPVLAFLWDPIRQARKAEQVAQGALGAGGRELDDAEAKATLLAQLLLRRVGLQANESFDTLVAHHPKGKPVWDLKD